jgi:hypothetical protein
LNEIVSLHFATWFFRAILTSAEIAKACAENALHRKIGLFLRHFFFCHRLNRNGSNRSLTSGIDAICAIDRLTQSKRAELLIGKIDSNALPQHHTEFPNRPIKRI